MRQRIDAGSIAAAVGAALLVVSLFVAWYDPAGTGWQVFEVVDVLLVAIAGATLAALAAPPRATADEPPWWVPALAAAALAVVVVQLVDPPPAARAADRDTGAWLALAGALLLAAGALLRRSRISISVDVRQRETRRRVPAVDRREDATEPTVAATPAGDPQRTQPLEELRPDDDPRGPR